MNWNEGSKSVSSRTRGGKVVLTLVVAAAIVATLAPTADARQKTRRRQLRVVKLDRFNDRPEVDAKGKVRTWIGRLQQRVKVKLSRLPTDERLCLLNADNGDVLFSWNNAARRFTYSWGTRTHAPGEGRDLPREVGSIALVDEANRVLLYARLDQRGPATGVDRAIDLATGEARDLGRREGYVPPAGSTDD